MPRSWKIDIRGGSREERSFFVVGKGKGHIYTAEGILDVPNIPGLLVCTDKMPVKSGKWSYVRYEFQVADNVFPISVSLIIRESHSLPMAYDRLMYHMRQQYGHVIYWKDERKREEKDEFKENPRLWDQMKASFDGGGFSYVQFESLMQDNFPEIVSQWEAPDSLSNQLAALD
jgi:hypothetical protein